MATMGVDIYIDGIKISDTNFIAGDDFEITSTGLVINGTQVWTYSGNLIFDGFAQLNIYLVGTTGNLSDFIITSNNIHLNTLAHAEYYRASYADLSSIANAVRNKLGTADRLEFPTGFVRAIGDITGGSAEIAVIDVDVANGTATITSGEFPDWCTESNNNYIYGSLVTQNIILGTDNFDDTRFGEIEIWYEEPKTIIAFLSSGDGAELSTDLTSLMIDGVNVTSGAFEVVLIYCDPWSSGTTDEPIELDEPIENNDPVV